MSKDHLKIFANTRRAVKRCLLRNLRPCERLAPLMSESLERRLGVGEWLELRLHLLVCAWCSTYFKQLNFLRSLVRLRKPAIEDSGAPVALSAEARERIANSLRQR